MVSLHQPPFDEIPKQLLGLLSVEPLAQSGTTNVFARNFLLAVGSHPFQDLTSAGMPLAEPNLS